MTKKVELENTSDQSLSLTQPFTELYQVDKYSRSHRERLLEQIEAGATEPIKRIFRLQIETRESRKSFGLLTKTHLDLATNRLLSETKDLFHLVGYLPETQTSPAEKSNQEKVTERLNETARRLVGETLPHVTLTLIKFCNDHQIPLTDIASIFEHFGPIDYQFFPEGLKYSILEKETDGEFIAGVWGEVAKIFVLLPASQQEDDWQCYVTAQQRAHDLTMSVAEIARHSESLPAFFQRAYGLLADLTEKHRQDFSQLIVASLPHRLKDTQKILSLLALGTAGVIEPSRAEAALVQEAKPKKLLCLSNLADFESIEGLINAFSGQQTKDTIYYLDLNHIDELKLRMGSYDLCFKGEPLYLISGMKGEPRWGILVTEPLEGPVLERVVRNRLSEMGIPMAVFEELSGIVKKRLDFYRRAKKETQEMPLSPKEFLKYHWETIIFLANTVGHSETSARAMETVGKFIKEERPIKGESVKSLRKHLVRMAGYLAPDRFYVRPGEKKASSLEDLHDVLKGTADFLDEIERTMGSFLGKTPRVS